MSHNPLQSLIDQAARLRPPAPAPRSSTAGMLASLRLEAIGDNYRPLARVFRSAVRFVHRAPRAHAAQILDHRQPWVARIRGLCPRHGYDREFLTPRRDYSESNASGSRGIYLYFLLPEGIYEVHELLNWTKTRRYFVRSEAGEVAEISADEVPHQLAAGR